MARQASIEKNERRRKMATAASPKRLQLKAALKNRELSWEDRQALQDKLNAIPKNASPVRVRLRCALTGRPRGNFRKFGICRIKLRELGSSGMVPGLRKSSW